MDNNDRDIDNSAVNMLAADVDSLIEDKKDAISMMLKMCLKN